MLEITINQYENSGELVGQEQVSVPLVFQSAAQLKNILFDAFARKTVYLPCTEFIDQSEPGEELTDEDDD
jgi:hypothetical protein